jgi:hypothetical protein
MVLLLGSLAAAGCGLFEPRDPDPPTQQTDAPPPATDPDALIQNLQAAVAQKSTVNYERCFAGFGEPSGGGARFVFVPSPGAAAAYSGVFQQWGIDQERQYFQNLVSRSAGKPNAYANLTLTHRTLIASGDSAVHSYDYTLTFEHSDPAFPQTATGTMQLVMAPEKGNAWVIYRWIDYKTTGDITWSHFKGKFSN